MESQIPSLEAACFYVSPLFPLGSHSLQVVTIPFPGPCYWRTLTLGKKSPALPRTEARSTECLQYSVSPWIA